jgi:hypothetical protein
MRWRSCVGDLAGEFDKDAVQPGLPDSQLIDIRAGVDQRGA